MLEEAINRCSAVCHH